MGALLTTRSTHLVYSTSYTGHCQQAPFLLSNAHTCQTLHLLVYVLGDSHLSRERFFSTQDDRAPHPKLLNLVSIRACD